VPLPAERLDWPSRLIDVSTFEAVHEPLVARDVLLGRTTHVRRLVPNKTRRMIGAWCFLDHYGPDDIKATGGMWVPPHPHTGLQTVTWLFEGLGLHTDSLGSSQLIRPGQLNVMTAGHGICHAEVSPPEAPTRLHGVQLWVCLPEEVRDSTPPDFTHLAELPTYEENGATLRVLVGSLAGEQSPAPAHTPLVGVEVALEPGAAATVPLEPGFEYGVLVVHGGVRVDGVLVERNAMNYLGSGRGELTLKAEQGERAVLMLLGGEPFEEHIVMWWNFIGRSHEEIVEQREAWNGAGVADEPQRFGTVRGFDGDRLLAPPMPNTRLKPRGRTA
jgi:redox-sensitive bicupin YhaK (pirin superfamily)